MEAKLYKRKSLKMGDMAGRIELRPAQSDDVKNIALMMDYLGYPALPSELKLILSDILSNPAMKLFLAVYTDGKPIGLINLRYFPVLRLKGYQVSRAVRLEVTISNKRESYKRKFYTKNGFEDAGSSVYRINLKPRQGKST
jgi:hypothetical protein